FLVAAFQASLPYIKSFGDTLVSAFNAAMPTIQAIMGFLGELAGVFMDKVVPAVQEAAGNVIDGLIGAFNAVAPMIGPLVAAIGDFVGSIVGLAQAIMSTPAFQFLINVLQVLATLLVSTIIPLLVRLGGIVARVFVAVIGN